MRRNLLLKILKELTLKEEQTIQLDILKHFSYICENENLRFFLAYGTLLGACRNNGFIPWDDDIDIWMPRKDYTKFLHLYSRYKKKEYFLQTAETDPGFIKPEMARICVNETYKSSNVYDKVKDIEFHRGIYFDIFPLDYGFGDWRDYYYTYKIKVYSLLLLAKTLKNPTSGSKNIIKRCIYKALYFLNDEKGLRRKIANIVNRYSSLSNSNKVVCLPSIFGAKTIFESVYFENVEYVLFEGMNMPCPDNYHTLLRSLYGDDYMTPKKMKKGYNKSFLIESDL